MTAEIGQSTDLILNLAILKLLAAGDAFRFAVKSGQGSGRQALIFAL
jgi:hypothetical protein